jgi:hypothetical protein
VPRLFVPKPYQSAIETLLKLDRQKFSSLVSSLENLPEIKGERLRLSSVTVRDFSKAESEEMLDMIEMLYRIWSSRGNQSLSAFVDDLSDAIAAFYPNGQSEEAKTRLMTVLNIEPLACSSKALSVSTDHQRVFYDAKVLSDIRFAFRPDVEAEPYGATIVHILKLVYHEDNDHKNFFVALDDEDLSLLKRIIERAERKTEKLRNRLDVASVRFLGKNGS